MIVIINPSEPKTSKAYKETLAALNKLPNVEIKEHEVQGKQDHIIEIYLLGDTHHLSSENIEALPAVSKVIRISQQYKMLGRHDKHQPDLGFDYNGITFNQDNLNILPGLCAVDNIASVEATMKALQAHGLQCTRMGAYKPRTSPYSFQGLGKACLDYLFDLAGKYDIKVIAMEVTHERHIDEINETLERLGHPTGVMLQVGTRNAQNFELLRAVGSQTRHPILFKRGFGISLDESLNATEYLAHSGNAKVVFCLRGMKSLFGAPHRNLADFAHVPVIKRLTRMPVCIDPSHSVGSQKMSPEGISDVFHATAQGIIAGANMVLVDFHPQPKDAVVDAKQAISINQLGWYLDDIMIAREAFEKRKRLAENVINKDYATI